MENRKSWGLWWGGVDPQWSSGTFRSRLMMAIEIAGAVPCVRGVQTASLWYGKPVTVLHQRRVFRCEWQVVEDALTICPALLKKIPMCPDGCCWSGFNLRRESVYDSRELESEPSKRCLLLGSDKGEKLVHRDLRANRKRSWWTHLSLARNVFDVGCSVTPD